MSVRAVRMVLSAVLVLAAVVAVGAGGERRAAALPGLQLYLPVPWGATVIAGGPHPFDGGSTGVRSSVDLGRSGSAEMSVHAAAAGTAHVFSASGFHNCWVSITHVGGWETRYYHMKNVSDALNGASVAAGDRIGDAGMPGSETCGVGNFRHVHFSLYQNGQQVAIDGVSIGGYTVHATGGSYCGYWTRDADGAIVADARSACQAMPSVVNNQLPPGTNSNPVGNLDGVSSPAPGAIHVAGWTFDPDAPATPIHVHVYVGGPAGSGAPGYDIGITNVARSDVQAAFPQAGPTTGYDTTVPVSAGGNVAVYVYGINIGAGTGNPLLGTKTVGVADPNPVGYLDGANSPSAGMVHVSGWAFDPNAPSTPVHIHIYLGGPAGSGAPGYDIGVTNVARPDVHNAYPAAGPRTGFDTSIPTPRSGAIPVYAYAINIGVGDNRSIGNATANVVADTAPPTVAMVTPTAPFTLSGSATATWSGFDSGTGVAHYDVRYQQASYASNFGPWMYPAGWQGMTGTAVTLSGLSSGIDYCFSARAIDRLGNASEWSRPRCVARPLDDRSLAAGRGWARAASSVFWNRTATTSSRANALLKRTGVRLDRVGIVATRCSRCGVVGAYVNGKLIGKINLRASRTAYRQLLMLPRFSYRTGTVTIKTLTRGHTVQIDGLAVSKG